MGDAASIDNRARILSWIIIGTIVCLVATGLAFLLAMWLNFQSFVVFSTVCGALGGFVSIQQRFSTMGEREANIMSEKLSYFFVVPVYGALFSMVFYCLVYSGLVTGDLFPKYDAFSVDDFKNLHNVTASDLSFDERKTFIIESFNHASFHSPLDVGKHIIWSFFAGFSERFVPRLLSTLGPSR